MKNNSLIILCLFMLSFCSAPSPQTVPSVITTDIDYFWQAYDQIKATEDSTRQMQILKEQFLDKGTPGLDAIMQVRRYTPEEYLHAINNYPKFWSSIRPNMRRAKELSSEIDRGVAKLRTLYPALKPAKVYFTIGVFRTGGTTLDSLVLIGSEITMADENTITEEFPENLSHLKAFYKTNPIENIAFLNVHEFVHTQQNDHDYILAYRAVYEGVAEFVAEKAMEEASKLPALAYGKKNEALVKKRFTEQMYSTAMMDNWLYNNTDNEFNTRDLGYYVGYAICEKYYEQAGNKQQAIKDMIELDYSDEAAFEAFVNTSGYFDQPISDYKEQYEKIRPEVVRIQPFENGSESVDPELTQITFIFSEPMNTYFRSTGLGELGRDYLPEIQGIQIAEDGLSVTYELALEPDRRYQFILERGYRTDDGRELKPFQVDFKTSP